LISGRRRSASPGPLLPKNIPLLLRERAFGPTRERIAFRLIDRLTETIDSVTYVQLWNQASAVAGSLEVSPGDAVVLLMESSLAFYAALFGSLLTGALPVAVYPPAGTQSLVPALDHLRKVLAQLPRGRAILTTPTLAAIAGEMRRGSAASVHVIDPKTKTPGARVRTWPGEALERDQPVLLQYTSGSLGDPRAIALSTRSIFANLTEIGDAFGMREGDVGLSWLPLYHDMGLHSAFFDLMFEMQLVLMSPLDFIRRPQSWIQAIGRYRITHSPAPSFGYAYAARRIRDEDLNGADLSSWRVAMCGAEPIDAAALNRFAERFERYGFQRKAFMGAYGLAENTVAVSFAMPQTGLRVERVASVGVPLGGHDVRIMGSDGNEAADGAEGEIQVRGPSRMSGYLGNEAATRDSFDGEWLRTGDLGFVREGELFVTGRSKDLIIRAGKNYYPHDLEAAAGSVDGIRPGAVAAFGLQDGVKGTEEIVVVAEVKRRESLADGGLRDRVRKAVLELIGLAVNRVELVEPGAVPKTTSGKIRRGETRARLQAGTLKAPPKPGLALLLRLAVRRLFRRPGQGRSQPTV
jgi:acyl-CoA synthetase (AMP-forming)/AMP-acid ligase II